MTTVLTANDVATKLTDSVTWIVRREHERTALIRRVERLEAALKEIIEIPVASRDKMAEVAYIHAKTLAREALKEDSVG